MQKWIVFYTTFFLCVFAFLCDSNAIIANVLDRLAHFLWYVYKVSYNFINFFSKLII